MFYRYKHILGGLFGVACGDALGGTLEFMSNETSKIPVIREYIEKHTDYIQVFQLSKEEFKPTEYVFDSLTCALWYFINSSSFEDAVCEAANLGGDTDTIVAISGGLAGVYYGYDAIPERWKEKILVKDRLTSIAKRMLRTL